MEKTSVISFSDTPLSDTKRRLSDLPDRVVEGDPHHSTQMCFESPDGALIAGTWTVSYTHLTLPTSDLV